MFLKSSILKEKLNEILYQKYLKAINNYEEFDEELLINYIKILNEFIQENECKYYALIFTSLNNNIHYKTIKISNKTLNKDDLFNKEIDASSIINTENINHSNAKGLVSMDTNSTPFIIDKTLYIPSLFKSINNTSLDHKTPLMKSIKELNNTLKELFNKLNENYDYVLPYLGIEQEFYLLFSNIELKENNINTYLNVLNKKQYNFINEVINKAENIGIEIEAFHLEGSINQIEIINKYTKQNIALDHNIYLKEIIKNISQNNNNYASFDDKPFPLLHGSGKHNNYSLITNKYNVLTKDYDHYLLVISAFILGIDKYSELIRLSSSSYSNEKRLGSKEAPSSVITISLNNELEYYLKNPHLYNKKINNSLRNRTSPIVLVDNKFEFRMLGSSIDATFFNTCLNVMLISSFKEISLRLDKEDELDIIKDIYKHHKRIIYNKNNYDVNFFKEIKKRKINNLSYYDSIDYLIKYKSLFIDNNIMNEDEINLRIYVLKIQYINDYINDFKNIKYKIKKEVLLDLKKKLMHYSKINKEYLIEYQIDNIEFIKQMSNKLNNYCVKLDELIKNIIEIDSLDQKYLKLKNSNLLIEINECFNKLDEI